MKIYKIKKSQLKWKDMNQIQYKWVLPILINKSYEVIIGNSLKDSLLDEVLVCIIDKNQLLEDNLFYIESKVVEENSIKRIGIIDAEIREYFIELRKPVVEQILLLEYEKNYNCISESNYKRPNETITHAHGIKSNTNKGQIYLLEEEKVNNDSKDIIIDLEIMKELL